MFELIGQLLDKIRDAVEELLKVIGVSRERSGNAAD